MNCGNNRKLNREGMAILTAIQSDACGNAMFQAKLMKGLLSTGIPKSAQFETCPRLGSEMGLLVGLRVERVGEVLHQRS
jgi:hypothetical protein